MLYVDGVCNPKGSKVGITLEGPRDISLEQSLRFDFKTFNNEVEYEALIVGLKLAKEVGVKKLRYRSDSKLITGQVNRDFQAKDPQMQRYYHLTMCLFSCFEEYELKHISRENNDIANMLSKLESSKNMEHHKTFIQEITPSIDRSNIFANQIDNDS